MPPRPHETDTLASASSFHVSSLQVEGLWRWQRRLQRLAGGLACSRFMMQMQRGCRHVLWIVRGLVYMFKMYVASVMQDQISIAVSQARGKQPSIAYMLNV